MAKLSKKAQVLAVLEKAGPKGVSVQTLIKKCGERSPARIYDLRKDGVRIETTPSRGPACKYVFLGRKRQAKKGAKKNERATA